MCLCIHPSHNQFVCFFFTGSIFKVYSLYTQNDMFVFISHKRLQGLTTLEIRAFKDIEFWHKTCKKKASCVVGCMC